MKKIILLSIFLVCINLVYSQTMTFNSGASEPGFNFSGWSSAGGTIWMANLASPSTITIATGTWNLTSFYVGPFTGNNDMQITSNLGNSYNYNTASTGTHTLNWAGITSITFTRLSGSGSSADYDNFVYSVNLSCIEPTIPTVFASPTSVCPGNSSTLSISGTLNDATQWNIYTGSCGGTLIGTTATSSFTVTPGATTTYYIRGEGGCTTPGACGTTTITVNPLDNANFNYSAASYCVNGSDPTPTITGLPGGTFSSNPAGLSINASSGAIDVSASTPNTYTVTYTTVGTCPNSSSASVTINAIDNANFNYSAASYCVNGSDPTPTITGLPGGTFSSNPAGLSINASSGAIDVSASTPNTYTVTYTTAGTCPNSSSASVTINAIDNANFNYSAASYCVNGSDPTPTITGLPGGTFSSNPAGLSINASSGAIDVSASTPNTYTVTYTTAGTCPNSSNQIISINPVYNLTENDAVCSGDSYTFPDGTTQNNITTQVVYTSNLLTTQMCDSIITTTIDVNPVYNLTENDVVCSGDSYTFPDGTTQNNITAQVVYTSNLLTTQMCDSIITTTIDVNPVYNLTENDAVCSGDSYTFPDGTTQNNITAQVVHTSNLLTTQMCDSIITTTIDVNPAYNLTENDVVCSGDSYTFPDGTTQNNITAQVVHTSNLLTTQMCDSIITTTIDVNPVYNLTENDAVCSGDSYTFPDGTTQNNITAQVVYTSNLLTTQMCDSIITTTIDVNPVYNLTENDVVCSGDSYTFPDGTTQNNITAQVVHTSNLLTTQMCDSIITTTIDITTVNISVTQNLETLTAVLEDASYQWLDCSDAFNPIVGENNQTFIATSNGSYAVEITDGDCVGISNCFDVTTIFIDSNTFEKVITAFPNPTNGNVNIDLGITYNVIEATITDSQGRIINEFNFQGVQNFDIEFEGLPGIYFIIINADSNNANLRLIKK